MDVRDVLNEFKVDTVEANDAGSLITFTFKVSENPDLDDYKVRSKLVAVCMAYYPLCESGMITNPVNGIVTARFVRRTR